MAFEELNTRDQFFYMLEWMLVLERRHGHALQVGLVHIAYDPIQIRDLTFSASDTATKLDEIKQCLNSAFRKTDLVTRDGMGFWIIAPFMYTDPVTQKVNHVIKTAPQNGLAIADSNVRIFIMKDYLEDKTLDFKTGQEFLDHLLKSK